MIETNGERESGKSVLATQGDDDEVTVIQGADSAAWFK